jgi:hypothetical protein
MLSSLGRTLTYRLRSSKDRRSSKDIEISVCHLQPGASGGTKHALLVSSQYRFATEHTNFNWLV